MEEIIQSDIENEMQTSYISYAMSVIVGRALPDARDGLKPAQRRILFAMYKLNNTYDQPTKKSARIVGHTMGLYHPHGDAAVYDTLVRMAQYFSMNYMLVQGQGNMGCFTKDTKIKLLDGRDINFDQLVTEQNNGKRHWTFTFNTSKNLVEITEIKNPRLTRKNAELVEVTLDNGNKIRCTPDHRFLLHDGTYKQAKDLEVGTSLMPAYIQVYDGTQNKNLKDYEMILQPHENKWQFIHHLSDEWNLNEGIYTRSKGRIRHHCDFNKRNNNPDNISRVNWKEHWEIHWGLILAKNNPQFMSTIAQLAKQSLHKNWQNPDYKKRVIRSKILGFVSLLISKYQTVTPLIYESERKNNGIPKISNALQYFSNFEQIVEEAKTYNHKVKGVIFLKEREDVYDITVNPWHNFALSAGVFVHNSIDGDPPAAQRYTEVRLSKIAEEVLADIEKQSVPFVPNFDNTEEEPVLLPTKIPNLLINGASGIAVGVATNILPHNLSEISDAVIAYVNNKEITSQELLQYVQGPDFPTGGTVFYNNALISSYITGRGGVTIRGKVKTEKIKNKNAIIITEIPYTVNKATMVENIAALVREKRIQGISGLRDESGKEGIRVVIELRQDADVDLVLNMLYTHTQLEISLPVMNIAVMGNNLLTLNLRQFIKIFVDHRAEVIKKRTKYDLKIAADRLHIVEGLLIAVMDIENVITTIKASKDVKDARETLIKNYKITEKQSAAILDMKLSRLTNLETGSLESEKSELNRSIMHFTSILAEEAKVYEIIKGETTQIKEKYGRERRTTMDKNVPEKDFDREDLIVDAETTIITTNNNYMKRIPTNVYRSQDRGGKGVISIQLKEGDYVKQMVSCRLKDYLLIISNKGRAYWLKAYMVPEEGRYGGGKAAVNLVKFAEGEKIGNIINTRAFADSYLTFITSKGRIKRLRAEKFARPRSNGIKAMPISEGEELSDVCLSDGKSELFISTKMGKALRFNENDIRPMSRTAQGVRGIRLNPSDSVINVLRVKENSIIASITEKGYGKVTEANKYRLQKRGGKGVLNLKTKEKTGHVVRSIRIDNTDNIILINSKGISITFPAEEIRITGRAATGVRLMRLDPGAVIVDAQTIAKQFVTQAAPAST